MQTTRVDARSALHACAVPESDEQLWEMTAAFRGAGPRAGPPGLYSAAGPIPAGLARRGDDRVPVSRPLAEGQLTVVDAAETRRVLRGPVRDAATSLATEIDRAVGAGYPGFRVTGQLSSGLGRADGVALGDFDIAFDAALTGRPARLLCLYDRHRFPDRAIEALRALHPFELDAPALYDDNLLRVTRVAPFRIRLAGEVDHSNRPVLYRLVSSTLDEALRSHDAPPVLEFDVSSLRFLDVAGAVTFVHAAEGFPESHRLALHGARPAVVRVLDRVGAPFAAQLDVTAHPGLGVLEHGVLEDGVPEHGPLGEGVPGDGLGVGPA